MQPGQRAVITPGGEVPVHRQKGRLAVRQVPPGAPGPVQLQDRIDDRPQRPDLRPAAPPAPLSGQVRGDDLPLGISKPERPYKAAITDLARQASLAA